MCIRDRVTETGSGRHLDDCVWQIRSLQTWADQVEAEMNQEEVVRDVTSVTSRLQLHQQLKAEIDAREDTFTTVAENGQLMIDAGHFAATDVWLLFVIYYLLSGHKCIPCKHRLLMHPKNIVDCVAL